MTRQISMATRRELTQALGDRYQKASRTEKAAILDEFATLTTYHRKHAIRVLNSVSCEPRRIVARSRVYDEVVRQALVLLWRPPTGCAVNDSRR